MKRMIPWAAILLLSSVLGFGVFGHHPIPAAAQGDDDLERVVAELTFEVAALRTEVADLRADVADLRASSPGHDEMATVPAMPNVWTLRTSDARAVGACDAAIGCAYQYSDWGTLTFDPDDSMFTWQGPYATGTFEVFPLGTGGNVDVVLTGTEARRCTATFYATESLLEVRLATCPGFMVENQYIHDSVTMHELDSGALVFQPLR
jgi:hypothetical protein